MFLQLSTFFNLFIYTIISANKKGKKASQSDFFFSPGRGSRKEAIPITHDDLNCSVLTYTSCGVTSSFLLSGGKAEMAK